MRDVLSQISKLLALAESPAEEEARSAAMQAVRLIKKHKIELRMPGVGVPTVTPSRGTPYDGTPPSGVPYYGGMPYGGSISDYLAWLMNNPPVPKYHYEPAPTTRASPRPAPDHTPPKPQPPPPPPPKKPTVKPVQVVARFDGKCPHCKTMFYSGDEILWMKRRGATHAKCEKFWEEKE